MLYPSDHLSTINIWDYDKIWHFVVFLIWTLLYGLVRAIRLNKPPQLWIVFTLGLAYGLLVEFLQFVIPTNRSPEIADFIADALGSLVAIGILHWIFKSPLKK